MLNIPDLWILEKLSRWIKRKKEIDFEKENLKEEYNKKIAIAQRKFLFYCPVCLFQTNTYSKKCPKCNKCELLGTNNIVF